MHHAERTESGAAGPTTRPVCRRLRATTALWAVLAAILLAAPACTSGGRSTTVQTGLTQPAAQSRLIDLMTAVLGRLPESTSLARSRPDDPSGSALSPLGTVPCDDSDTSGTGPVNVQGDFWVVESSGADGAALFASTSEAFSDLGWSSTRDRDVVRATTSDGYLVDVELSPQGWVSTGGSTPCFPKAGPGASSPPDTITHP